MADGKFFPLLILVGVACDSPTEVIPPEPEDVPEDVAMTFVMPYPRNAGPGVPGATITCLEGCPEGQTLTTDSSGNVTFLDVFPPLRVEARKEGYITRQLEDGRNRDSLVISHVWPEESEGTFERLLIPKETILHWGPVDRGWSGVYSCPIVVVREKDDREAMFHTLEHELYHAHQDSLTAGRCTKLRWVEEEDGRAYIAAWEDDLEADRRFPPDTVSHYEDDALENAAEFYAWWVRHGWNNFPRENLCTIAPARCRFMEDRYGPRPDI